MSDFDDYLHTGHEWYFAEKDANGKIWYPIDTAPKDGTKVWVRAELVDPDNWHECMRDLPPIECTASWHELAGWCVDWIREVVSWRPIDD